jgi:phospholipid-transporting ATPase
MPNYITDQELLSFPQVTNVDFRDKSLIEAIENSSNTMH